jgi:hypothetical protein
MREDNAMLIFDREKSIQVELPSPDRLEVTDGMKDKLYAGMAPAENL